MISINILNLNNKINKELEHILKITNLYDKIINLSKVDNKTINQALVELTQQAWLRKANTERFDLKGLHENKLDILMPFFVKLNLCTVIKPKKDNYNYAIILGSLAEDFFDKVNILEEYSKTIKFKQLIILTGKRLLIDKEKEFLKANFNIKNNLYETDMILSIFQKINLFPNLSLLPMTIVDTPAKKNGTRPNTNDTIHYWLVKFNPKADTCLAISANPYIAYQESALKTILPDEFKIEVIGNIDKDLKTSNAKVALILDSLARWIYQENIRLSKN